MKWQLVAPVFLCGLVLGLSYQADGQEKRLDHSLDVALGNAIVQGKTAEVVRLIGRGADPNAKTEGDSATPMLALAAASDVPVEIPQALIRGGANLEVGNSHGDAPLAIAAMYGRLETSKQLLSAGAKIDAGLDDGITALMFAAATGHSEEIRLLISAGANVNLKNKDGLTPLIFDTIKFGDNPAPQGNLAIARLLVDAGADVSVQVNGATAKELAEKNGQSDVAAYLEKVRQRDEDLLQAVSAGRWADVKTKLAAGANARYQTRFYEGEGDEVGTVATTAFVLQPDKAGFDETMALQVLTHSDLEVRDDDGRSALFAAVGESDATPAKLTKARLLLKAGANPETRDSKGDTVLMWAASRGASVDVIKMLLAAGAKLETAGTQSGKTPLMSAAESGWLSTTKALFDAGANKEAKTPQGKTALSLALAAKAEGLIFSMTWEEIIDLLQRPATPAPDEDLPDLGALLNDPPKTSAKGKP